MEMMSIYRHIQNRTKEMGSYYILVSTAGFEALFTTSFHHHLFHVHFASIHSWLRFSHDVVIFISEE